MQTGWFKKISISAALAFALGGCSVSPSFDAITWTFDGMSYFLTGKGAVDHAVSAASGRDCSMMRAVKGETTCVARDEDVAGDRLVFQFDDSSWTAGQTALDADGDPLSVNPAIAGIVAPLGNSVRVETRSTAIAAVAADTMPIHAGASARRALVKDKAATPLAEPGRATRLWLPVE